MMNKWTAAFGYLAFNKKLKCSNYPCQKSSGFCLSLQLLFSSHFFRKANHLLLTLLHVTQGNVNLPSTPARTTQCAAPAAAVLRGFV